MKNRNDRLKVLPRVTVIIPTYNRADIIYRAINSLKRQSLKEWKAIILDDGSTDHTHEVVDEVMKHDSRFFYFRMEQNLGICHVLNHALQLVETEYMVQLDSDDWLENNALERLLLTMEDEPDSTALIYSNYKIWKSEDKGKLVTVRGFRSTEKYDLISYVPMVYPRFYRVACLREVGGWETDDKYNGRFMEDRRILFKLIEKYDFRWVSEHLYNLSRFNPKRLTAQDNVYKYGELKKELVFRTLIKWGNEYTAKFISENEYNHGQGWYKIKLIPNHKGDKMA